MDKVKTDLRTVYKEYGITNNTNEITFEELGPISQSMLCKPMTQFNLFAKYLGEYRGYMSQPWVKDRSLDENFFNGSFD